MYHLCYQTFYNALSFCKLKKFCASRSVPKSSYRKNNYFYFVTFICLILDNSSFSTETWLTGPLPIRTKILAGTGK